jgi:hypothetical protein
VVATRWNLIVILGLAATALAGCQNNDEIRRYQVPRVEAPRIRMLGAMIPHEDRAWFFKILGPAQAVAEHKDRFEQFIRSVRFTGKGETPLTWTVPDDWQEEPEAAKKPQLPGPERYATFRLPSKEHDLELTVIPLKREGKAESVLDNVNRWRAQFVGLPEVAEDELGKVTTELKIGDVVATLVDMTGPGPRRAGMRPPMAAGGGPVTPPVDGLPPLDYKLPDGWQKVKPKAFSVVTFRAGDGDEAAEITVSSVGGDVLLNVNRWRTMQLGLAAVSEEQLRKDLKEIDVGGGKAPYVELIGPEKNGRRMAILGVMTTHAGTPWVVKMSGPADVVSSQKPAFETFVRSVKFDGGKGAQR